MPLKRRELSFATEAKSPQTAEKKNGKEKMENGSEGYGTPGGIWIVVKGKEFARKAIRKLLKTNGGRNSQI
jgi:hypothetical protein